MSHDTSLQRAVLAELNWEPSIPAGHIGVAAENGVVTLTGHVSSYAAKRAAETAAARVRDVKAVAEEIEVRIPAESRRDDSDIAAAAAQRLIWDVRVPDGVQAVVDHGLLTLIGEVDWHFQKESARESVQGLQGVVAISNQIRIKPKVNVANLSDEIVHALHRSWFFDPKTVTVTAQDGIVHLTGVVHTPHERQVAATTAWSAPGVTDVRNEILVG